MTQRIVIPKFISPAAGDLETDVIDNINTMTLSIFTNYTNDEAAVGGVGTVRIYNGAVTFDKTQDTIANGVFYNKDGITQFAHGMDFESEEFYIWCKGIAADLMRINETSGKINLGKGGSPVDNAANITVRGNSAVTDAIFALVATANSGNPVTPFVLYAKEDGKIGMGVSDTPTENLDVGGSIRGRSQIKMKPGDINTPSYTFQGDTTIGMTSVIAGRLGFIVANKLAFEISPGVTPTVSFKDNANLLTNGQIGSGNSNARIQADKPSSGDWTIRTQSKVNAIILKDDGKVGLTESSPTSKMDLGTSNGYDQLRLRTSYTPTSTADTNGNTGDVAWDDDFFYVKTSAGWKKSTLATF